MDISSLPPQFSHQFQLDIWSLRQRSRLLMLDTNPDLYATITQNKLICIKKNKKTPHYHRPAPRPEGREPRPSEPGPARGACALLPRVLPVPSPVPFPVPGSRPVLSVPLGRTARGRCGAPGAGQAGRPWAPERSLRSRQEPPRSVPPWRSRTAGRPWPAAARWGLWMCPAPGNGGGGERPPCWPRRAARHRPFRGAASIAPRPPGSGGAGGLGWGVGAGPGRRRGRCDPASLLPQADPVHRAAVLRQGFESRGTVWILWSPENGPPGAVYLRSAAGVSVQGVEPRTPRVQLLRVFLTASSL